MDTGYFEEYDPSTGERSSFGGISEAAAEYHARGEMCPWDCWRCELGAAQESDERSPEQRAADEAAEAVARQAERDADLKAYNDLWPEESPF